MNRRVLTGLTRHHRRRALLLKGSAGSHADHHPASCPACAVRLRAALAGDRRAGMCSACEVSSESFSEFNALPDDWASDPVLIAGLTVDDDDEHDDPVLRWPDGRVVDTWREDYPYAEKMPRQEYEYRKRPLQVELVKLQNWVKSAGAAHHHRVRGPRRGGQGRHDQALHRAPEPPRRHGGGADQAERAGTDPVVLPALRAAPARGGRDRHVRPLLVQPGGRGAGDGLHARSRSTGSSCGRRRSSSTC